MPSQLFYKNIQALSRDKHKDLRISRQASYDFARETNSLPVAGFEFFETSRAFPIFFIKSAQEEFVPVVLLSLTTKSHSLGDDWDGHYVPAYVRRYPFILSSEGTVLIDEDAAHFADSEGDALFDEEGKPAALLDETMKFLETVDRGYKMTEEFCKALSAKGFLEPFNRSVNFKNNKVNLNDFYSINEKKMQEELSESEVYEWFKKGWLAWAHAQLHSLGAMGQLVKRSPAMEKKEETPA